MQSFRDERRVRHTPQQMFDLVADVEKYPQFVPLCEELRILRRMPTQADGTDVILAVMSVGYKAIRESFTTRVKLDKANLMVDVDYVDGPFRVLDNVWRFKPAGTRPEDGTLVEFSISYEFKSFALGLLMGSMFDRAFRKFAAAFEARADTVYGVKR